MAMKDAASVFVFPGQASAKLTRLRELLAYYPQFQERFDKAASLTKTLLGESLADFVFVWPAGIEHFALAQAATYVTSHFLYEAATDAGAAPAVVLGYGMGEITALAAAGVISFEAGLEAVCVRATTIAARARAGDMLELTVSADRLRHLLSFLDRKSLQLACINSDHHTVVSGAPEDIAAVEATIAALGLRSRRLASPYPLHSKGMATAVGPFLDSLSHLPRHPARIPVWSAVLNRLYTEDDDLFECLACHLVDTIDFRGAVHDLCAAGYGSFVDCGSQGELSGYITSILTATAARVVALDAEDGTVKGNIEKLLRLPGDPVAPAKPASAEATPPPADTITPDLTARIIAIYQDLTGYPREVLELDADLEAELGLDSVKQIEVVATIAETFGLSPNPAFAIGDHNTIARIIAYVEDGLSDRPGPVPVPAPAPARPAEPETPAPAADGIEKRIVDIYRDLTGYPPEVLELHADLEAELGLDSVKQIEIIATLAELFDLPSNPAFSIADHNTIARVTAYITARLAQRSTTRPAPEPAEPRHEDTVATRVSQIYQDLTGYPQEVLDHDADLEAELGLDSVKQIEVVATIAETFDLPDNPSFAIGTYNTIGKIVSYVEQTQPQAHMAQESQASGKTRKKKAQSEPAL